MAESSTVVRTRRLAALAGAVVLGIGGLAACSSGDSSSPATSAAESAMSPSASSGGTITVAVDKLIQEELIKVGCHPGPADGIMGPQTDAAVVRFQEASGLTVDGELGPDTDAALKADVAEGKTVCSSSASPTTTATPTPTPTSDKAACTAAAIQASLKSGEKLLSYLCADVAAERWAAGQQSAGPDVANFFMKATGGTWELVPNDEVCGTASAGLPQEILDYCSLT
jgi:Putative peptidoglycan binding domain